MKFAQWVFRIAGIYGLLVITPMIFLEERIGLDFPPPINHPEYYYGFVFVTIAWQFLFLVLSRDPVRYRLMMLPAIVEKVPFGLAIIWLTLQGRVHAMMLGGGAIDLLLGILFVASFMKTKEEPQQH